jgi:hypothetical protein
MPPSDSGLLTGSGEKVSLIAGVTSQSRREQQALHHWVLVGTTEQHLVKKNQESGKRREGEGAIV